MKHVLVEVSGGVAAVTVQDEGVQVFIFDWDNYKESSTDERTAMIGELSPTYQQIIKDQIDKL